MLEKPISVVWGHSMALNNDFSSISHHFGSQILTCKWRKNAILVGLRQNKVKNETNKCVLGLNGFSRWYKVTPWLKIAIFIDFPSSWVANFDLKMAQKRNSGPFQAI